MDLQLVFDELFTVIRELLAFLPRLINGVLILVVGIVLAIVVRWLLRLVLSRLGFDTLMDEIGLTGVLRNIGVRAPVSRIVAQAAFLLLVLSFLATATRLMGLVAVAVVVEQLLNYLPQVLAALVVFGVGSLAASFIGDVVSTIATSEGLAYGRRLGRLVQYIVSGFVAVLALSTLGIQTAILITSITIMLAAFGLALGLSLGLGGRHVLYQIFTGYYARQRFPIGQRISVQEVEGEVTTVGSVNTVVTTAEGTAVIPNSVLFESVVRTQGQSNQAEPPSIETT